MNSNYLQNLTREQRQELRAKAAQSREDKKKAGEHLKKDWADEAHMRGLASEYGIRLPSSFIPNTEIKYLRRVAKKLNINLNAYVEACGVKNLKQLVALNPDTPAWVEVCHMLEVYKENKA